MSNLLIRSFLWWLPIGAALTCAAVLTYGVGQQVERMSLNDPQIEVVRNVALAMEAGALQPKDVVARIPPVDIGKSLSPFVAIYDESGNLLESSGTLNGAQIEPPKGLFPEATKRGGEYLVSWQPAPEERIALVLKPMHIESGWIVVAGRNMEVVEERIQHLGQLVLVGWLASLLVTLAATFAARFLTQIDPVR